MKLVQFYEPGQESGVGIFQDDQVIDLSEVMPEVETVNDLLYVSGTARLTLSELVERAMNDYDGQLTGFTYESLDVTPDVGVPHLMVPIFSPEVWGFGVTYKRSAEFRDDDAQQTIYDQVYQSDRPESFFKATASRCSGPNAPICVRGDSSFTATEPELAYVLGEEGEIVGYTLCNDVSAWDIEKANPLYLNSPRSTRAVARSDPPWSPRTRSTIPTISTFIAGFCGTTPSCSRERPTLRNWRAVSTS